MTLYTNEVVILTPPAGETTSAPYTLIPIPVEGTEETQPASETFIISVKDLDSGSDDAIFPTEPRGQSTEIDVNFYTKVELISYDEIPVVFADGRVGSLDDLAVGQTLEVTGIFLPSDEPTFFLGRSIVILP